MTWIQTYSGRVLDLVRPDPEAIHIDDLVIPMSVTPRFSGHTVGHLFPADLCFHSLLVESLMPASATPSARLAALLHDAHEAFTGDITSPMRQALAAYSPEGASALKHIQFDLQDAVERAVGLNVSVRFECRAEIKQADLLALAIEKRDLMGPSPEPWSWLPDPADNRPSYPGGAAADGHMFRLRLTALIRESGCQPMGSFGL